MRGAPAWEIIGQMKRICSTPNLELTPPGKKMRTKNDELVKHLHEKPSGKNIEGKNEETSHP